MAKLKASNVPHLPRSDQYLEFQITDSGLPNNPLRYVIGILDPTLDEFVISEDFIETPINGRINTVVSISDISSLDAGTYQVYLFHDTTANQDYTPNGESLANVQAAQVAQQIAILPIRGNSPNVPITIGNKDVAPTIVRLDSTPVDDTTDEALWDSILATDINFNSYKEVMDQILFYNDPTSIIDNNVRQALVTLRDRLPFSGVEEYSLLKFVTNIYMRNTLHIDNAAGYFGNAQLLPYYEAVIEDVNVIVNEIAGRNWQNPPNQQNLRVGNRAIANMAPNNMATPTYERLTRFPAIELLWSYWMEQGMLVQTINTVSLRFQNVKGIREVEPLGRFDTSPLRALSHILWGYIQDEQHTVPLSRRVNEYDHEYGLKLLGRAVPEMRPVDTRSKFLEAFHNLLAKCAIFYKEIDDTTRKPDGFPIYTSLKEVHLLLAEGNHNAYQNLTWTVRQEMMVQQYILARQEMREFLGGRPMMPYQERWMDKVDTMKMLQGWDSTSIIHYYDLAYCGEKLLLGIRYGNWNNVGVGANQASNWAVAFRNLAQKYIHGYQTVAGVDLSADAAVGASSDSRATQPSLLIAGRSSSVKQTVEIRQRAALGRY